MAHLYPQRFSTYERDWLLERLQQSDVRTLRAAGGDSYLKAIADLVRPDFEKIWTKPYGGETDLEYADRRSNAHKDKKTNFPRRLPETQEAWERRRSNLSHNIHRFVIEQFCTKSKRKRAQTPSIPVPDVPRTRKARRTTGLDVYQGDLSGKQVATAASSSGEKYPIGDVRTEATQSWHKLSPEQREPYETRARARTQERAAQNTPEADGHGEEAPADAPFSAQVIAGWLKLVLEKLGTMNWGGFICAGGPDANGDIRTYIDFVGYNRHGENLLESVNKAACFSEDELESLVTLWVEQAKSTDPGPPNRPEALPYQVLRALQIQKQQPEIPAPEILATVLSEAFEAQQVALRSVGHPASQSGSGPAFPSVGLETHRARPSPSSAGLEDETIMEPEQAVRLATQPPLPTTNAGGPRIPDPLADGPFGIPGSFTVNTSGMDFQWGGEFTPMNADPTGGNSPDDLPIPTSNVRTNLDEVSVTGVDNVVSVLTHTDVDVARAVAADVDADHGKSRAGKPAKKGRASMAGKKAGSRHTRRPSPSGVLMPDAHGAQPRTRPPRERQLTEKGQNYAAERSKARRK